MVKDDAQIEFLGNLEERFAEVKEVKEIADKLTKAGFEAFLVGGCLRDLLMDKDPKDWDIATNAKPEEIQKVFPESVYENQFGTVAVKTEAEDPAKKIVEVTTYRLEGKYTDKRHPDEVKFAQTIDEDLSRRDFTVNAIAFEVTTHKRRAEGLVDPFYGLEDLKNRVIRAVGNPNERFQEDALRLMRAVRFAAQLDFTIESETAEAVKKNAGLLEFIAKERIRDELEKIIMTPNAAEGIKMLQESGLLRYVLPELQEGVGVGQNKHHIYEVFEHSVRSLDYAARKDFPFHVRLAALLHDVGKPRTKSGEGPDSTFYSHQVVGERMVVEALDRLHFPKRFIEQVALLVREHMFVYDPETVTLAGVRRLLRRTGKENIDDLFMVREADRIGSGVPKAQPYRLRHLRAMIEKVQQDPVHPKMLKVKGDAVMEILKIEPGPKVGKVLSILLDEVLDNPELNKGDHLMRRVRELGELSDKELDKLALQAKEKAAAAQERIDAEIKKKYFVK